MRAVRLGYEYRCLEACQSVLRRKKSGDTRPGDLEFRNLDLDACAGAGLTVDEHPVVVTEQNLEALVDIADADSLFKQGSQFYFGNTHAVIFDREVQSAV